MKIGCCGVRGLGDKFLKLFTLHPDVGAVAMADCDPAMRARERYGVEESYDSLEELLEADCDAIAVFTPPWLHVEQTIAAVDAGCHVLCACPAALDLAGLRALREAVVRSGKIYMTAETSYYYPAAMWAREAWKEGRFGDFVYGEGEYYYRPHAYGFWMRPGYATMPPMLYPTHSTAMVISVTGERIERLCCVGRPGLHPDAAAQPGRDPWRDNEISNMTMLGQLSGGGCVRINEMRNVGCTGTLGSIIGTHGSMRSHHLATVWSDGLGESDNLSEQWRDPALHPQTRPAARLPAPLQGQCTGHEGSHPFLVDEFVRAVRDDRRPFNDLDLAIRYCLPGIIAWESCRQDGDWLPVPDLAVADDGRASLAW